MSDAAVNLAARLRWLADHDDVDRLPFDVRDEVYAVLPQAADVIEHQAESLRDAGGAPDLEMSGFRHSITDDAYRRAGSKMSIQSTFEPTRSAYQALEAATAPLAAFAPSKARLFQGEYAITLTPDAAKAVRKLARVINAALQEAYNHGIEDGSSLLRRMANGEITADVLNAKVSEGKDKLVEYHGDLMDEEDVE